MNIEELREHCLAVRGAEENLQTRHTILAFKVMGKVFAYIDIEPRDGRLRVEMKCDRNRSIELRERYEGISSGLFPNATMWNAVYLESDVPDTMIVELIAHSVDEVIKNLPRKKQQEYFDTF